MRLLTELLCAIPAVACGFCYLATLHASIPVSQLNHEVPMPLLTPKQ